MAGETGTTAVGQIYADHFGWLQGLIRRRIGCSETAADLAQDAFLRLLRAPRRFESARSARAYLGAMAHGLCVDHWRRREIERAWAEALAAAPEAQAPSAEEQARAVELLCELDALLEGLPDRVAEAFVLAQMHGLPYRAIAARLDVSERMVKKYMARALCHCALAFTAEENADAGRARR